MKGRVGITAFSRFFSLDVLTFTVHRYFQERLHTCVPCNKTTFVIDASTIRISKKKKKNN